MQPKMQTYFLLPEKGPLAEELDEGLVALLFGGHEVGAGHERAGHGVFEAWLLHLQHDTPSSINIISSNGRIEGNKKHAGSSRNGCGTKEIKKTTDTARIVAVAPP